MKNVLLTCTIAITGCDSSPNNSYAHKTHGIGSLHNSHFMHDVESCKQASYSAGIDVNHERVRDASRLAALEDEYHQWLKNEYLNTLVDGIQLPIPKQYIGIDAAREDRIICLNTKGWNKS